MDPTTIAGALFSGLNAIVKGVSYGAHFVDVPKEVTQLQQNIQTADQSINTAKRLVRLKTHYLNPHLVKESQSSIDAVENVLRHVRDSIEDCRKDLEVKNTMASPHPVVLVGGVPFAPDHGDAHGDPVRDPTTSSLRSKPSFARSPSKRWLGSTSTFDLNSSANSSRVNLRSMKSNSSMTLTPESGHAFRPMMSNSSITLTSESKNYFDSGSGPRIGDGDEGYQSDDGLSTHSSRLGQSHNHQSAKPTDTDVSISFVAGSGLSIDLDDRRTPIPQSGSRVYSRSGHSYVSESVGPTIGSSHREVPRAHNLYELPGSYPSPDPTPPSARTDPFASNNPWRQTVSYELPTPDSGWESTRDRRKRSSLHPMVEDEHDTVGELSDASFLSPSVTAPASMMTAGPGAHSSTIIDGVPLLSAYEQKRLRRRRRSDFIN